MRSVPSNLDAQVVAEVDARLAAVQVEHQVRIPWAIESGSRAWGFPSPDSDYDCRFFFVRSVDAYLTLWPARDVIETPLDAVFDVNGWDLGKAIKLISKGNVVPTEWLRSPIVYGGDPGFRDRMLSLAEQVADRALVGRHYLHVGLRQRMLKPTLKRFFYALRPAAALLWLDDHPDSVTPPMDLPTLLADSTASQSVMDATAELIATKAVTRELGSGAPPAVLEQFVVDQLERAGGYEFAPLTRDKIEVREIADAFFRAELSRFA